MPSPAAINTPSASNATPMLHLCWIDQNHETKIKSQSLALDIVPLSGRLQSCSMQVLIKQFQTLQRGQTRWRRESIVFQERYNQESCLQQEKMLERSYAKASQCEKQKPMLTNQFLMKDGKITHLVVDCRLCPIYNHLKHVIGYWNDTFLEWKSINVLNKALINFIKRKEKKKTQEKTNLKRNE